MKPSRLSIKEIAEQAGVHYSTVSRVLTEHPKSKVATETKEKILKIIKAKKFYPNQGMRRLKRGLKDVLLLTLTLEADSLKRNPLYQTFHLRLLELVQKTDSRLVIYQSTSKEEDLREQIHESLYSHVIVLGSEPNASLELLSKKISVLRLFNLSDQTFFKRGFFLEQDHEQAGDLVLDFFKEKQSHNLLVVTSDLTPLHQKRYAALKKSLAKEALFSHTPLLIKARGDLQSLPDLKRHLKDIEGIAALSFSPWVYLRLRELEFDFEGPVPFLGFDVIPALSELLPKGHWLGFAADSFEKEVLAFLHEEWTPSDNIHYLRNAIVEAL